MNRFARAERARPIIAVCQARRSTRSMRP